MEFFQIIIIHYLYLILKCYIVVLTVLAATWLSFFYFLVFFHFFREVFR